MEPTDLFMSAIINAFEGNKRLAEKAVAQVSDEKLRIAVDENTNSIAVIMKHVAGNLLSRWTDFLSTDGEKAWRNRDDEFVDSFKSRAELLEYWEQGWACLFAALQNLTASDIKKNGRHPRRATYGAAGDRKITGAYLLPHRSNRTSRPHLGGR